ncbi:beta-D-glucoside glucohydrolase [Pseudomonas aeruginosa]|nr:beta-D-glucoside glucohydrolase [Pseudomonas aeruginosa]
MNRLCVLGLLIGLSGSPALAAGQGESGNPPATDKERFIASLMARMSNAEKIGQLRLVSVGADHPKEALMADIRAGKVGAIFNTVTRPDIRAMQDQVRHSRLKIPLFHAYDVAHGHRTIFPISLGLAASWDPEVVARSARISALEASADGLDMSFSPMVDITRDARWGRVSGRLRRRYLPDLAAVRRDGPCLPGLQPGRPGQHHGGGQALRPVRRGRRRPRLQHRGHEPAAHVPGLPAALQGRGGRRRRRGDGLAEHHQRRARHRQPLAADRPAAPAVGLQGADHQRPWRGEGTDQARPRRQRAGRHAPGDPGRCRHEHERRSLLDLAAEATGGRRDRPGRHRSRLPRRAGGEVRPRPVRRSLPAPGQAGRPAVRHQRREPPAPPGRPRGGSRRTGPAEEPRRPAAAEEAGADRGDRPRWPRASATSSAVGRQPACHARR